MKKILALTSESSSLDILSHNLSSMFTFTPYVPVPKDDRTSPVSSDEFCFSPYISVVNASAPLSGVTSSEDRSQFGFSQYVPIHSSRKSYSQRGIELIPTEYETLGQQIAYMVLRGHCEQINIRDLLVSASQYQVGAKSDSEKSLCEDILVKLHQEWFKVLSACIQEEPGIFTPDSSTNIEDRIEGLGKYFLQLVEDQKGIQSIQTTLLTNSGIVKQFQLFLCVARESLNQSKKLENENPNNTLFFICTHILHVLSTSIYKMAAQKTAPPDLRKIVLVLRILGKHDTSRITWDALNELLKTLTVDELKDVGDYFSQWKKIAKTYPQFSTSSQEKIPDKEKFNCKKSLLRLGEKMTALLGKYKPTSEIHLFFSAQHTLLRYHIECVTLPVLC